MLPSGKNIVDVQAGKPGKKASVVRNSSLSSLFGGTQDSDINFFRQTQQKLSEKQKFTEYKGYLGEPAIKKLKNSPKIKN